MRNRVRDNSRTPFEERSEETSIGKRGFALIEILIVIGVILILIVVSFPNLQQARLASDVVKAKGGIHFLVVALETYFLDFGFYPAEHESDENSRYLSGLFWLTSPIPYIDSVPIDPFSSRQNEQGVSTYELGGVEVGGSLNRYPSPQLLVTWCLFSTGPDLTQSIWQANPHYAVVQGNSYSSYSPTNGTVSRGDIFQYGGDPFWIGVVLSNANRETYENLGDSLDRGLIADNTSYLHKLPPPLK